MYIIVIILLALVVLCLLRAILGPTVADRMVAIDILGILVVGICAIWAVITKQDFLIDIAFAWIIFSFIGTLALAKYLSKRGLDE